MTPTTEERLLAVLERLAAILDAQRAPATVAPGEGTFVATRLVDADGLASVLRVSRRTLRRLDETGVLPAPVALGHLKRWSIAEVEAWIRAGAPSRRKLAERRAS